MKVCRKCGVEKPLNEFWKKKQGKDGYNPRCRVCARGDDLKYREANLEACAKYYRANKERLREYHAGRYRDKRESINARVAEYAAANPHMKWESRFRERAKQCGFDPVVVSFTREELVARHGDACFHCGGVWSETDHYPVPIVRGGEHSLENVVPSCLPCNRRSWRETA
ncbi:HNH endonuclease [Brevibacterium sp. 239c]|uniref:HNH endonuclease n=1 Tax=Brevibacterium sp. 239c TaxID=1965356 RepID=UPI000C3F7431|nr:HNH endonuclease [Brevibacterium sp. 239c]